MNQTHSTQRRLLKDACVGGLMEKQIQKTHNPAAATWYYKEEPVAQNNKAWRTPLRPEPVLRLTGKVKRIQERHGTTISTCRRTHPMNGSRLLHGLENPWKTTWRSKGRFECEFGYLGNVHEYPLFEQQFISEKTMA